MVLDFLWKKKEKLSAAFSLNYRALNHVQKLIKFIEEYDVNIDSNVVVYVYFD